MPTKDPPGPKLSAKTGALPLAFLVLLLSLLTWYFFYIRSMPLAAGDTAVVVVFWIVVVIAGKWLLSRYSLQKKKTGSAKKKFSGGEVPHGPHLFRHLKYCR